MKALKVLMPHWLVTPNLHSITRPGDMIVQEADLINVISIKLRESSMARLTGSTRQAIHCCLASWRIYQASAGTSNKQHLPLTMPLVVCLILPLFAKSKPLPFLKYLCHYTKLAREIAESQKPNSNNPLVSNLSLHVLIKHMCIIGN